MTKETLGQKSLELLQQKPDTNDAREVIEASEKEYAHMLEDIIKNHRDYAKHYFIEVKMLQENLHRRYLPNVFTRKFFVRKTPPSPQYDTTCLSFDNPSQTLFFHWTLPSPEGCIWLKLHEHELNTEEREVFEFVNLWVNGKLDVDDKFKFEK